MGEFCKLVKLHREGSNLQPAQQACFDQFTQYKEQKKTLFACMVRVGVPQMSWAVRYLDKLQWRAVKIMVVLTTQKGGPNKTTKRVVVLITQIDGPFDTTK